MGVIYANVEAAPSISDVLCSIDEALSNIRISDIDRKRVSIHDLTRKINSRIPLYDKCLLILDNCNLTPGQLKYFIRFLRNFNKSIGIVFRLNLNYYNQLKRKNKKWQDLYDGLLKVTDDWKEVPGPSVEDIRDICIANGISDAIIIDDLIRKHGYNISRIRKSMDDYFDLKTKQYEKKEKFSAKNRSQGSKDHRGTSRHKEHQIK